MATTMTNDSEKQIEHAMETTMFFLGSALRDKQDSNGQEMENDMEAEHAWILNVEPLAMGLRLLCK